MERDATIFVAGRRRLITGALERELRRQGYENLLPRAEEGPDLADASQVEAFFQEASPDYVFMAGGLSGGIGANQSYPADLIRDNLLAECHIVQSAYRNGVKKLLYLGSSCMYPKHCPQPMKEEHLLTGPLEPTSQPYAVAKIAGITLCQAYRSQHGADFISAIPGDAFGPEDDFSLEDSHVVAALIRKFHDAKTSGRGTVEVWGTGKPTRGLIFADDLACACIFAMRYHQEAEPINLSDGRAVSVGELAGLVKEVVGYEGEIAFDPTKPDGMPSKLLDASRLLKLGWKPKRTLREALEATYRWFLEAEGAAEGDFDD